MSFSDEGDAFFIGSLFTNGWTAFVLAVVAVVFYLMSMTVQYDCEKVECPPGQKPTTIEDECACVGRPIYRLPVSPGEMR